GTSPAYLAGREGEQRDPAQPVMGLPIAAQPLHETREGLVLLGLCDVQIVDRDPPDDVPVVGHLESLLAHGVGFGQQGYVAARLRQLECREVCLVRDRKSTRLNSSHVAISYAVFCLKKKKKMKKKL